MAASKILLEENMIVEEFTYLYLKQCSHIYFIKFQNLGYFNNQYLFKKDSTDRFVLQLENLSDEF